MSPRPISAVPYNAYKPVESLSAYSSFEVNENGSVVPRERLTPDIVKFLEGIGANVSLWNGEHGVDGIHYIATQRRQAKILGIGKFASLREQYRQLKTGFQYDAQTQRLRKDIDVQCRLRDKLESAVAEMQIKASALRNARNEAEAECGTESDVYSSAHFAFRELQKELVPAKKATDQVKEKISVKMGELAEKETASIRRLAILDCLFGSDESGIHSIGASNRVQQRVGPAAARLAADAKSLRYKSFCMTRIYMDAKKGLAHLYNLESTLKAILENLRRAMDSLSNPVPQCEEKISASYRLRYVRKLRLAADEAYQASLPFVRYTSIGNRHIPADDYASGFADALPGAAERTNLTSTTASYSTFSRKLSILPDFSKHELVNALDVQRKIAALHRDAAVAYKEVNEAYDTQERLLRHVFQDMQAASSSLSALQRDLVAAWEELLESV